MTKLSYPNAARLHADWPVVRNGRHAVERGLTGQALDDPRHAYSQLLCPRFLQV